MWTQHIMIIHNRFYLFSLLACKPSLLFPLVLHCFDNFDNFLFHFSQIYSCLVHLILFLNCQSLSFSCMVYHTDSCYHGIFLFISILVVLVLLRQLQLSPSSPSQHSVLETCSVGGRQLHARHTLGRVLWAFSPL